MESKELWIYRLLLPLLVIIMMIAFPLAIASQISTILPQLLITLFGVLIALVLSDWFKIETKSEDAFSLKRDLLDELEKTRDSIKKDPFEMLFLDIWEIGRSTGSLGYLTRKEQSEYGLIYSRLRRYLLQIEEYTRMQISGPFNGTKDTIRRNQKNLISEIENFLNSHEELTYSEKIRKRFNH